MNGSTLLAIFGTAATLIFGTWGIYLTLKRRYPGQITFFRDKSIGLFDSIVRNLPELEVLYRGSPVSQNLVLLNGFLLNTGSKDITQEMVSEKLAIVLPEEHKWLAAKIVSCSPGIAARVDISGEKRLEFDLGLFRCREFMRFEALAEVPDLKGSKEIISTQAEKRLIDALTFEHRIADTQKVNSKYLNTDKAVPPDKKSNPLWLAFGFSCICVVALAFLLYSPIPHRAELHYFLKRSSGSSLEVKVQPLSDGTLTIEGVSESYKDRVKPSEFFSNHEWEPKISSDSPIDMILIFSCVSGFIWFMALVFYVIEKRERRLKALLTAD